MILKQWWKYEFAGVDMNWLLWRARQWHKGIKIKQQEDLIMANDEHKFNI